MQLIIRKLCTISHIKGIITFICVCLSYIAINGHYNQANLLCFYCIITFLLGMSGKESLTPSYSTATGLRSSVGICEWVVK